MERVKNYWGNDIGSIESFTKDEQRILKNRAKRREVLICSICR